MTVKFDTFVSEKFTSNLHLHRRQEGKNRCDQCGVEKRLRLLEYLHKKLPKELADKEVDVLLWEDVVRSSTKKNGQPNMQRELTQVSMTIPDHFNDFRKKVEVCIPHHANIR